MGFVNGVNLLPSTGEFAYGPAIRSSSGGWEAFPPETRGCSVAATFQWPTTHTIASAYMNFPGLNGALVPYELQAWTSPDGATFTLAGILDNATGHPWSTGTWTFDASNVEVVKFVACVDARRAPGMLRATLPMEISGMQIRGTP